LRSVIIILIFSCRLIVYCQTINSGLNFTDTQGLKQGKWTYWEIDTIITPVMSMTIIETDSEIPSGITNSIDTIIYKYLYWTGYYYNNKKDSIWMIYNTIKQRITSLDDKTIIGNLLYVANFKNDTRKDYLKLIMKMGH
jgi:hypothetical protein